MVSYFNQTVADMDIDRKYKMELLGMITAILQRHDEDVKPQPEIIRCKDCRWWDKHGDYDNGYCMAAKHGYWSEHWDITIRRVYKGDFYCADAEPKGEQE